MCSMKGPFRPGMDGVVGEELGIPRNLSAILHDGLWCCLVRATTYIPRLAWCLERMQKNSSLLWSLRLPLSTAENFACTSSWT